MDANKVNMYLMSNADKFPSEQIPMIRQQLENMTDDQYNNICMLQFQNPTVMLIISIFLGNLGIDRFMVGDIGLGVVKLITCGGAGIWTIVDWFLIMGVTRQKNFEKFMRMTNLQY
ncbi:MAG: NINE protein [Muribaculaceae bacterium]|nr:NINE protein [Muribaculaceae bacterium]